MQDFEVKFWELVAQGVEGIEMALCLNVSKKCTDTLIELLWACGAEERKDFYAISCHQTATSKSICIYDADDRQRLLENFYHEFNGAFYCGKFHRQPKFYKSPKIHLIGAGLDRKTYGHINRALHQWLVEKVKRSYLHWKDSLNNF